MKLRENILYMRTSHTRGVFDDRLFGKIYPLLGWDIDCECKYYLDRKEKQIDGKTNKNVKKLKKTDGKKKV